jgi:hypothetical protein
VLLTSYLCNGYSNEMQFSSLASILDPLADGHKIEYCGVGIYIFIYLFIATLNVLWVFIIRISSLPLLVLFISLLLQHRFRLRKFVAHKLEDLHRL